MGEAYAHDKRLIRRQMEARRRELSHADAARLSAAACERVLRLPAFSMARHVVAYAAIDNELDPALIAEIGRAAGKTVYYPDAHNGAPDFLRAPGGVSARDEEEMSTSLTDARLPEAAAALLLVPGVAFDLRGGRLGRGRGWYDQALARYPAAIRIGLAYEFQVVPVLPEAPWDVRMHALVTEARMIGEPPGTVRGQKED